MPVVADLTKKWTLAIELWEVVNRFFFIRSCLDWTRPTALVMNYWSLESFILQWKLSADH